MDLTLSPDQQLAAVAGALLDEHCTPDGMSLFDDSRMIDHDLVCTTLARVATRSEVSRTVPGAATGVPSHVQGSMAKLFSTDALVETASELLGVLGAEGQLQHGPPDASCAAWLEHAYRHVQVTTIYGGTSEIQRSIIAEHALGLARSR